MEKAYFITSVDTDSGKTFVCLGLLMKYYNLGLNVGYYKPLQSGSIDGSVPDIDFVKRFMNIKMKYSYLFEGEISPHLASLEENIEVSLDKIKNDFDKFSCFNDLTIVEGAGGLYCPAFKDNKISDVIQKLNLKTIIVSDFKLGRLNHLLMTLECAKLNNIDVCGIILNRYPKNPTLSEKNFIKELKSFSDVEILGIILELEKFSKDEILNAFKGVNL